MAKSVDPISDSSAWPRSEVICFISAAVSSAVSGGAFRLLMPPLMRKDGGRPTVRWMSEAFCWRQISSSWFMSRLMAMSMRTPPLPQPFATRTSGERV